MRVWLAEKPDQGRRLADVLSGGRANRKPGYIETPNGVVTWAIGHLLQLADMADYDPGLKEWRLDPLPFVPQTFQHRPRTESYALAQLNALTPLVQRASEIIIATDADREGELIARELLAHLHYRGAIRRLWLSALDPASIRKAVQSIRPGADTEGLAKAASARSAADWLVGLNATRIVSLRARVPGQRGSAISIGRVQTPTLALVVRRDRERESFKVSNFYELSAVVETSVGALRMQCAPPERITVIDQAKRLAAAAAHAQSPIRLSTKHVKTRCPKPFSLSTLQAAADRELSWPASKTLQVAQALYEQALLTYPRTDCEYLPAAQSGDIPAILAAMHQEPVLSMGVDQIRRRGPMVHDWIWNDSKVTAHHAIIPTTSTAGIEALSEDAQALYRLVGRRFLQMLASDRIDDVSEAEVAVTAAGTPLVFRARRKQIVEAGWSALGPAADQEPEEDPDALTDWPPLLQDGMPGRLAHVDVLTRKTTPPEAYTEGTLIADMRSIAKYVTDPALKAVLKETSGIGTEATRADVLKTLKERNYLARKGRQLLSTPLGRALIDDLPDVLVEPTMTARWEQQMAAIERGELTLDRFVADVAAFVRDTGARLKETPMSHLVGAVSAAPAVRSKGAAKGNTRGRSKMADKPSDGRPSDKMLALARDLADRRRERLPPEVKDSFNACRAWIDQHCPARAEGGEERAPSAAQLEFAERLAARRGWVLPSEARATAKACSAFIDSARQ